MDNEASDLVKFTDNAQIKRLLNDLVCEVEGFAEYQVNLVHKFTQIGYALSAEKNIDRLLELIVDDARNFTRAEGGTLYIMSDDETSLHFAIVQNTKLNIRMGGTGDKITWPPVLLKNEDGSPNFANVSAYAALSGKAVNIADVYDEAGFNFQGTHDFDADTGYRSQSMIVVPLKDHDNEIIGVLQLLNAQDSATGEVISFSPECQQITESLASQAAVSLSNHRLINSLEVLLESFITMIASAVDEKSPYTGGHIKRVADLTLSIAASINCATEGPYARVSFDEKAVKELRMAALLHDIGKITTPEYVVDKATKLQTIHDRIEILKTRFEVLKRDREITALKGRIEELEANAPRKRPAPVETGHAAAPEENFSELTSDLNLLLSANTGDEFMAEETIVRIKEISTRTWTADGQTLPLLTENELDNLTIQRGTLTEAEREIINKHALVTYKMLSKLPFPRQLRNVARYAAAHHEKLDGAGYPFGLKGEEIPLQARIMALADIFEALTAKDRPYRVGKTLAEALKIMSFMAKDGHLDKDLFDLFLKEKIYLDYALNELSPQQIDTP
ncbi:MAG: HD domain-containing phosphohydrolase [Syntrophales bacterium]